MGFITLCPGQIRLQLEPKPLLWKWSLKCLLLKRTQLPPQKMKNKSSRRNQMPNKVKLKVLGTMKILKVMSLFEDCFDLISGSSLSMNIQIMGGKITENLGFKSPLRKVKTFLFVFIFIFKYFTQNWVSLNLTTFWYLVFVQEWGFDH